MNIRFADRTFEAVKNQPSLFVDHTGLTLNTVDVRDRCLFPVAVSFVRTQTP